MKTIQHLNTPKFNPTAFRAEVALHVLPSVISRRDTRDVEYAVTDAFLVAESYCRQLHFEAHRDAKLAAKEQADQRKAEQKKAKLKAKLSVNQATDPTANAVPFPGGGES